MVTTRTSIAVYCILIPLSTIAWTTDIDGDTQKVALGQYSMIAHPEIYANYQSSPSTWVSFLTCWYQRIRRHDAAMSDSHFRLVDQTDGSNSGIRKKIAIIQSKLNIVLPQSYVDFVLVTNAEFDFQKYSGFEIGNSRSNFLPIDKLARFRSLRRVEWQQWRDAASSNVDADRYFRYKFSTDPAETQDSAYFPKEYLDQLIMIGEIFGQGYILLNPAVISHDGEMEAWDLSWSAPGAVRYRSFAELMQNLGVEEVGDQEYGSPYPGHVLRSHCARHLQTTALSE